MLEYSSHVLFDDGLELKNRFLSKCVGDYLAFACVFVPRSSGENRRGIKSDESVVAFGLEDTGAVTVDGLEGRNVGDGNMVRRNADDGT